MSTTRLLKLSSAERDLKTSQNTCSFNNNVNNLYEVDGLQGVIVKQIHFTNTFNTFVEGNGQNGNNHFQFSEGPTLIDVKITEGFYNVDELAAELQTQINASSYTGVVTVVFNAITERFDLVFTVPVSFLGHDLKRHSDRPTSNPVAERMGFEAGQSYGPGTNFSTDFLPKLATRSICIHSAALAPSNAIENSRYTNLLSCVPIQSQYGETEVYISQNNPSDVVLYDNRNKNLEVLDIRIRSEDGYLLTNNGQDITILLQLVF